MRRPTTTRQTRGHFPLIHAPRTNSSSIKSVPHISAGTLPAAFLARRPAAQRAPNERPRGIRPLFRIRSSVHISRRLLFRNDLQRFLTTRKLCFVSNLVPHRKLPASIGRAAHLSQKVVVDSLRGYPASATSHLFPTVPHPIRHSSPTEVASNEACSFTLTVSFSRRGNRE
jgi:hypothetical protein